MTDVITPPSSDDYGYFSNDWMLKQALSKVTHLDLYRTAIAIVTYLTESDELDPAIALDLMAQVAFTGRYIATTDDTTTIVGRIAPAEENPITEEEIEAYLKELEDSTDAEDPFDGYVVTDK